MYAIGLIFFCLAVSRKLILKVYFRTLSQKMKANVYDKVQAPDVAQPNELGKLTQQKTKAPARKVSAKWLVPAALILLSFIPLVAGALRLIQLAGGPEIIPSNPRFSASPLPLVVHIVNVTVYAILGAFQFATGFRQRRPGWHRAAERLLVLCGLLVGLSWLWMIRGYVIGLGAGTQALTQMAWALIVGPTSELRGHC